MATMEGKKFRQSHSILVKMTNGLILLKLFDNKTIVVFITGHLPQPARKLLTSL